MKFMRQKGSQKATAQRLATVLFFLSLAGLTPETSASTLELIYTGPKYDFLQGSFGLEAISLDPISFREKTKPSDPNAHLTWGFVFDSSAIINSSISGERINSWYENDGVYGQIRLDWSTCIPSRIPGCDFAAQIEFKPGTLEVLNWNLVDGATRLAGAYHLQSSLATGDVVSRHDVSGYAYRASSSLPGTWSMNVLAPDPAPVPIPSVVMMFASGLIFLTSMLRTNKSH